MELTIIFFALMFLIFFIFFYYAKKDNKKEKTIYIDVENESEKNEKELPIIRY